MPRLVIASGNRHKVGELARAVHGVEALAGVEVLAASALGPLPTIVEDRETFAGNATVKALGFAAWLRGRGEPGETLVLADDSGLCVDALDGAPGVYSARFAGADATDADNNRALVRALEALGLDASPSHYVCALALGRVDAVPLAGANDEGVCIFTGRWDGEARTVARGDGGFGYDPHVWLDGRARTVAELRPEEKGARSHRGAAIVGLLDALPRLLGGAASAG
ncbi:MAG: non-canonical purine NTP pyrophosphatase [Nannocystaceae bacterium]